MEYVLHAQGINVSAWYIFGPRFFLIFLHVDFNMIISATQSMTTKWHSGGDHSEDKRLTLISHVERGADSLDSKMQMN